MEDDYKYDTSYKYEFNGSQCINISSVCGYLQLQQNPHKNDSQEIRLNSLKYKSNVFSLDYEQKEEEDHLIIFAW